MIKVAITGGIGSGKSTVCKIFNKLGIQSFDSDSNAKLQYNKSEVITSVSQLMGNDVLTDGKLDIKKISMCCFKDRTLLNKLTDIVSDGIFMDYYKFVNESPCPYTLFESAIIFSRKIDNRFDKIIGIVSEQDIRIERVMNRSKLTREEVLERMNNQVSDSFIYTNCDYIIHNNGNLIDLSKQVAYTDLQIKMLKK